jgi:hypothetical protein
MNMKSLSIVIACAVIVFATAIGPGGPAASRAQTGTVQYEADFSWPQPLPNRWALGGLGGVCVDAQDHVLILNRQDVNEGDLNGARLAPPIIEFDPAGNVVNSWGDLKVMDPRLHSCHFDADGNVWIAAAPSGMLQKYSHDGSGCSFSWEEGRSIRRMEPRSARSIPTPRSSSCRRASSSIGRTATSTWPMAKAPGAIGESP